MTEVVHINCGRLVVPTYPTVVCHCLALRDGDAVALVDTGIGLLDVLDPGGRLGNELIDAAGYQFNERDTAVRRLEALGIDRERVEHVILTHADPDHTGGLADFPNATVHVSAKELAQVRSGRSRYVISHFEHSPRWRAYEVDSSGADWFGLPAVRIDLPLASEVWLVALPGHTLGHCGVAVQQAEGWFLHVGDAYYLRAEIRDADHPVDQLAAARSEDNERRLVSLDQLRRIARDLSDAVAMCGYHDITELPAGCID